MLCSLRHNMVLVPAHDIWPFPVWECGPLPPPPPPPPPSFNCSKGIRRCPLLQLKEFAFGNCCINENTGRTDPTGLDRGAMWFNCLILRILSLRHCGFEAVLFSKMRWFYYAVLLLIFSSFSSLSEGPHSHPPLNSTHNFPPAKIFKWLKTLIPWWEATLNQSS